MVDTHMSDSLRRVCLALLLALVAAPGAADAQQRSIVAKSVSASSSEAALEIHFADDGSFEVSLEHGRIIVDGSEIGTFEPGDALDESWRNLLVDAMTLENGELARALEGWTPPSPATSSARELDRMLEQVLADEQSAPTVESSAEFDDESSLARFLLRSMGRLGVLDEALDGLDEDVRVYVDEDVVIPAGTVEDETVVVIQGTLRVEGTLDADAVLVGGTLEVVDGGEIRGQARVIDSRVRQSSGEIEGGVVDLLEEARSSEDDLRTDLRTELRTELRDEIRDEIREDLRRELRDIGRDDGFSPFRPVVRGVGGVVEKLVAVFLLGLLGAGFIAFAGQNVDAISETARRSPGRAAAVGFAGSFLLIPVWILGAIALIVSIVGIPIAIAWLPLFPLAAGLAALLGIVAVARNTGEWLADSSLPWTGWIRKSNQVFTLFGGLLGLAGLFIAGHVVSIVPLLGVFSTLFFIIGTIFVIVAMQIGFGAVLLTRAGRRREYSGRFDPDAAWAAAMDMDLGKGAGRDGKGEG